MSLSKHSIRAIVFAVCALFLVASVHAQFRAGVQGTVTDRSGAVVKGAKVAVTDQETGVSQEVVSNDEGFYSVTHLAPGLYTITASMAGFKEKVVKDVRISAEEVSGLNLSLEPGVLTEQVTVSGDTLPALQTEDASLTGTITKQQVEDLPEFRGDPFEILRITPGVFGTASRDSGGNSANFPNYSGVGGSDRGIFQTENAVQVSANGSRVEANGYQVDGVSTNSQGWGGASILTPNTESVKEINVEASPYSAENGHGAGAIVQVVSQNGTNDFHGSAVLRIHSPGMNAFQRWGGPNGASPNRDNQGIHDTLGSLGGPILKNKLFAFFSFDHMKVSGASYRTSDWVETPQWISNLPASSLGAKIFAVPGSGFVNPKALPTSCALLGLPVSTTTCQDGTGANGTKVVTGGVDIGSNTGTRGTIVTSANGGGLDGVPDLMRVEYDGQNDNPKATQYNGRIDYNVTKNDLVAFTMYLDNIHNNFRPGGWIDGRQYLNFLHDERKEVASVLWNRTIGPTMVNEARTNVARWYFDELKSNAGAPFGVPVVNIAVPNNTINAGYSLGPGLFYQTTYTFRDTLSKVQQNHVLKFGGEFAKEQNNSSTTCCARPSYDFNNLWSFANDAPNDQGFTTWDPNTGAPAQFRKYIRVNTYAFFGQDTWKLKPNLTLTLGLRYDYFSPLHEKHGQLSNIILGTGNATLTGAVIRSGGDLTKPDRNNFGPQIGFAWSPRSFIGREFNNKFVLRGGVGMAYNRVQQALLDNAESNPPFFFGASIPNPSEVVYAFSSGGITSFSGFPSNPAAKLTFDPTTGLPNGGPLLAKPDIRGPVQNLATPYTWHYSLEGQYDIKGNWVAAISYQGNQSRKYPRSINDALLYAQNPNINTVTIYQTDVNARYNAMLLRVMHHSATGLELSANYRFSKSMDYCSSDQTCNQTFPFDQRTEIGPSDFDVRHSFTANALYVLPFFKQRHDWLYTLTGGWKLGGILTLNSGFPWTPVVGTCVSNVFGNVCPIRPGGYLGGAGGDYSTGTFQNTNGNFAGYSSTSATCTAPSGTVTCQTKYFTVVQNPSGSGLLPPAPGIGRNTFRGPRYTGIDVSLAKRFTLPKMRVFGESAGFEIKGNIFNLFNKINVSPFGFNSGSTNLGSFQTCSPVSSCPAGAFIPAGGTQGTFFAPNATFGQATGALSGRVIEVLGKFSF